jgi:hypothetical protein
MDDAGDQDVQRHDAREHQHRPHQRVNEPRQCQLVLHSGHVLIQAAHSGDSLSSRTTGQAEGFTPG